MSEMRRIEIRSYLNIYGVDLDLQAIGRIAGVSPTKVLLSGEGPNYRRRNDSWAYGITSVHPFPEDEDTSPDRHHYPAVMTQFAEIERLFNPTADDLGAWCHEHDVRVYLEAVIHSETVALPVLDLSASFLRFAARLGAFISYDTYTNVDISWGLPAATGPHGDQATARDNAVDKTPQDQIETGL